MNLSEKYRPKTWAEYLGQPGAIRTVDWLREHGGLAGRGYYITGGTGLGKTTLAYLIAREIADDDAIEEMDASALNAAKLDSIQATWGLLPLSESGKIGRVWLVNEAHGLSAYAVRRLLVMLEAATMPSNVAMIFTTTKDGAADFEDRNIDADPFMDRLECIALTNQGVAKVMAVRLREIAIAEGLDGMPPEAYERFVKAKGCSWRRNLQAIGRGEMRKVGV